MNKQRITTKQLALCSVLLTLMLVLGWVESLFPPLMGVPGIKLGLSNGVLIFAVYMLSLPTAWVLMLLKVVLSSLFLGGVAALPYALAGGVLSLASMCLLSRMKWMHPVTVSIVGGVMHNVGQIVMAMIILHTSQLAYYMAVLMLSGILFGALTGGFLGDFIPQLCKLIDPASTVALPSLFDPLNDTMAIMVGSLVLGAIQVFTGMAVSVVEKCRNGHFPDALFDEITWWIILAGGAMALLDVGSVGSVPVVLCIGGVMLLYGAGRGKKGFGKVTGVVAAVYNGVTGFFSDILSYVRLMALMLSGAVLAQVFNMLGATTGNIVTFVIISLVGNTLNLALNLLGCYVHDMRLQFLEFFGRFYKDGGKAFRPLCMQSNYVEIVKEEHE